MLNAWDSVPDWATVAQDWERALARTGASAFAAVKTLDVIADHPASLAGMLDRPGAWLRREDVGHIDTIASARLRELLAEGIGPAADELALHLARIGGDRELVAALLIRATALGYPLRRGETLRVLGELAAARLEVEHIELTRQGGRPRLIVHGGEVRTPDTYAQTIRALAAEHGAMLKALQPVRFRPFIERQGRRRAASVEELRGGLLQDLESIAQGGLPTVMDPVDRASSRIVGRIGDDHVQQADETVQRAIRNAVIDAIYEGATLIEKIEKEAPEDAWIADDPPFSITLVAIRDDGYLVKLVDEDDNRRGAQPTSITVLVSDAGRLSDGHRKELGTFVADVLERIRNEWGKARLARPAYSVPSTAIRITPLTFTLMRLVGIEADQDLDFELGPNGAEDARPLSFMPLGRYGVAVHSWRLHAGRIALACPVNGGVVFRDDGHAVSVTVPRPVDNDALEREVGEVLRTPALRDLEGAFVDEVATDERGWSVLYVRSRPRPLAEASPD